MADTEALFNDTEDLLNICWNNVFKAVFAKDSQASRKALPRLISAVIGRDLEALGIVANEPEADVPDCDTRKQGFFPDDDFFHRFEYHDPDRKVSLGGLTLIHTLELGKLEGVSKKPVDDMSNQELWAVFFRYLNDPGMRAKINQIAKREEGIEMAGTVLLGISRNEAERARLESEYKAEVDLQSKLGGAKREGRREGRQERDNELLGLIAKGYTADDIRREIEAQS